MVKGRLLVTQNPEITQADWVTYSGLVIRGVPGTERDRAFVNSLVMTEKFALENKLNWDRKGIWWWEGWVGAQSAVAYGGFPFRERKPLYLSSQVNLILWKPLSKQAVVLCTLKQCPGSSIRIENSPEICFPCLFAIAGCSPQPQACLNRSCGQLLLSLPHSWWHTAITAVLHWQWYSEIYH